MTSDGPPAQRASARDVGTRSPRPCRARGRRGGVALLIWLLVVRGDDEGAQRVRATAGWRLVLAAERPRGGRLAPGLLGPVGGRAAPTSPRRPRMGGSTSAICRPGRRSGAPVGTS